MRSRGLVGWLSHCCSLPCWWGLPAALLRMALAAVIGMWAGPLGSQDTSPLQDTFPVLFLMFSVLLLSRGCCLLQELCCDYFTMQPSAWASGSASPVPLGLCVSLRRCQDGWLKLPLAGVPTAVTDAETSDCGLGSGRGLCAGSTGSAPSCSWQMFSRASISPSVPVCGMWLTVCGV